MKLGIKVNADDESFDRLARSNAPFAEVWFNVNEKDKYGKLFNELKRRQCDVGLHFWGTLDNNVSPNLAYPDPDVTKATLARIRETIDIAAQNGFSYVNVHPGMRAKTKVHFKEQSYELVSEPVDEETAISTFLANAQTLDTYAKTKHIVFTVETVPPRITHGWYDDDSRQAPDNIYELPVTAIVDAAKRGLWIANDFSHTAANIMTDDPSAVWTFLQGITGILEAQTRLIHVGFIIPPYNGTDYHGMMNDPRLQTDAAVPNAQQIQELLRPFQNRDDVWLLAEPKTDHVNNYLWVKKLVEKLD